MPNTSHLEAVYNERKDNSPNSTSLANTIETNIKTVISSKRQFIFELLQNADDCEAQEVEFKLIEDQLLCSHSGKHFSEGDVSRICNNATHDSSNQQAKNHDIKKTGYKGVGFKALFCISNKVTIISQPQLDTGYCFRFDKAFWESPEFGQDADHKYPWQIIPIGTDWQPVSKDLKLDLENRVHFLLENIEAQRIRKELAEVLAQPEILLSLRHTRKVTCHYDGNQIQLEKEEIDGQPIVNLRIRRNQQAPVVHTWYKEAVTIDLQKIREESSEFRDNMERMGPAECPDKLKFAPAIDIIFAGRLNDSKVFIPSDLPSNLFCYLPTKINTGQPFLVNTHLSLDYKREQLINNYWNSFLLEQIGITQFHWLAKIASSQYAKSMLTILPLANLQGLSPELQQAYHKGWQKGLASVAFLPSIDNCLLKVSEAMEDRTQFFQTFYTKISDAELSKNGQWRFISSQLTDRVVLENLKDYGLKFFQFDELLQKLPRYLTRNYDALIVEVLWYLIKFINNHRQHIRALKATAILKVFDNPALICPQDCYLPRGSQALADQFPIPIIAHDFPKSIANWLKETLGVRTITRLNILRGYIFSLIDRQEIGELEDNDNIKLFRFIYETSLKESLMEDDYQKLSQFLVRCQSKEQKLRPAHQTYINCQATKGISKKYLISKKYYQGESNKDWHPWFDFLQRLGMKTRIGLDVTEKIDLEELEDLVQAGSKKTSDERNNVFKMYVSHISQEIAKTRANKPTIANIMGGYLTPFIWFDLLGDIANDTNRRLLWSAIKSDWQKLEAACGFHKKGLQSLENLQHYIIYFIRHFSCVEGTLGQLESSSKLYAPHLQQELADLRLNFAVLLPVELSPEQVNFLGFKMELEADKAWKLLTINSRKLKRENEYNAYLHKIQIIYRYLLNHPNIFDVEPAPDGFKLLATNKELQDIDQLRVYDLNESTPEDEKLLFCHGFNVEQRIKLAKILRLPLLSEAEMDYTFEESSDGEANESELCNKIINYLPYMAVLEDKEDAEQCVIKAITKVKDINFQPQKRITGIFSPTVTVDRYAILKGKVLYYKERYEANTDIREGIIRVVICDILNFSSSTKEKLRIAWADKKSIEALNEEMVVDYGVDRALLDELNQRCRDEIRSVSVANLTSGVDDITQQMGRLGVIGQPEDEDSTFMPTPDSQVMERTSVGRGNTGSPQLSPGSAFLAAPHKGGGVNDPSGSSAERQRRAPRASPVTTPTTNNQTNKVTGRAGEKLVYDYLSKHYREKYEPVNFNDKYEGSHAYERGFTFTSHTQYGRRVRTVSMTVIWYNKELESTPEQDWGFDHDIKVIKNGVERYVEVKATKNKEKADVALSIAEWNLCCQSGNYYRIFCVSNVNATFNRSTTPVVIERIKNPYQFFCDQKFKVKEISMGSSSEGNSYHIAQQGVLVGRNVVAMPLWFGNSFFGIKQITLTITDQIKTKRLLP